MSTDRPWVWASRNDRSEPRSGSNFSGRCQRRRKTSCVTSSASVRSTSSRRERATTTSTIAKGPDSTAAQLRSKLNGLLQENVYLTSAATGAALAGRSDELAGAVAALGGNSQSLTDNVTAIFDAKTGTTFDGL